MNGIKELAFYRLFCMLTAHNHDHNIHILHEHGILLQRIRYDDMMMSCASCGVDVDDSIDTITATTTCNIIVRYCSNKCQQEHLPKHKQARKEQAAKLCDEISKAWEAARSRDDILFRQPESTHLGDCPICVLPLSVEFRQSIMYPCCCKLVCIGCAYASGENSREENLRGTCPFCRQPSPDTIAEADMNAMKRVEANDPVALRQMGLRLLRCHEVDYGKAIEYWTKAAELGDAEAHFQLSKVYGDGNGVEKDEDKEIYHLEEAAIGGHPGARYHLAYYDGMEGRIGRAVKHLIIAANLGDHSSIERLKQCYADGQVLKEDFTAALRAYQAAVDDRKSLHREEAEESLKNIKKVGVSSRKKKVDNLKIKSVKIKSVD